MRKVLLLLLALLTVFFTMWGVKAKSISGRPDNLEEEEETAWYENNYTAPEADEDWYLDPEIPDNYVPVPGEDELYMVIDDSGNIIAYRQRTLQDDGSWVWEDVNPDIPDDYEAVEGLDDVYKVTDEDGNVTYYLYIRNDDDTYCFVECDENGVPLTDGEDATTITDDFVHVEDNTYALYDDNGVLTGYYERVEDDDGNYIWKITDTPTTSTTVGNGLGSLTSSSDDDDDDDDDTASSGTSETTTTNSDGTYTITSTTTSTETADGYMYTYETTVYYTYDSEGNLLSTKKDGPYQVSKTALGSESNADTSLIKSTLDAELARVSASVTFDTEKAEEVLSKLNAERTAQGLSTLTMDTSSDVYKIACIRAADMAIYDHASTTSPMYGTLEDLLDLYGISSTSPAENIWKASTKTAAKIHSKFQANESSRTTRMSEEYTSVGIAIVEANDQTYIAEIYLY